MKNKLFQIVLALSCAATFAVAQPPASQTVPPSQNPEPVPGQTQPGYPPGTVQQRPEQLPQEQTPTTPQATSPMAAVSQIQDALQKQSPTLANKVNVTVAPDSSIQLSGTVDSERQKDQVDQIARDAAPNQPLTDNITVSAGGTPPVPPASAGEATAETQQSAAASGQNPNLPQSGAPPSASTIDLQSRVNEALKNDPGLSHASVSANVTDATVELTGTVPSRAAGTTAVRIAQENAGSRKVVDHLNVGTSSMPPL